MVIFEHLFLNSFSVGMLIAAVFNLFIGLYLLSLSVKSKSNLHLSIAFIMMGVFNFLYFLANSIYHPFMAYHRWITVPMILIMQGHYFMLLFYFPDRLFSRISKIILYSSYLLTMPLSVIFYFSTYSTEPVFRFEGHFWDFNEVTVSFVLSICVIVSVLLNIAFFVYRFITIKTPVRWAIFYIGCGNIIATVIPGIANSMSRVSLLDKGIFQLIWTSLTILGFAIVLIVYLNNSRERSSFVGKIIIIYSVVILVLMQFISHFSIQERDRAYDDVHYNLTTRSAAGDLNHSDLKYFFYYTTAEDRFTFNDRRLIQDIDFDQLKCELVGTSLYSRIKNFGKSNFSDDIRIFLKNIPDGFDGYRRFIINRIDNIPAEADHPDKWLISEIDSIQSKIFYISNRIRQMPEDDFRSDFTKYVSGLDGNMIPFRKSAEALLEKNKDEGKLLMLQALRLFSPMKPEGARHYRVNKKNTEHYVSYIVNDFSKGRIYEAGYSYTAYRRFIHNFSLKFVIILLVLVVVVRYGLQFVLQGALVTPLKYLVKGFQAVNDGNHDVSVPVKIEDEIGFITHSFNRMVVSIRESHHKIKSYTDTLELKVEERTHELSEANEKLMEMDKLKSNFFANISHEIRTPLTLILSPVESVLQGDYGKKLDKTFFENIQRNAIRLLKLINNLLDFSKIEAGRMSMKIQKTDIVSFMKTYTGSIHSSAADKGIDLSFVSLNDTCQLYIDRDKTDKIMMNLFSNALKFTDRGGSIKVAVKDDEHNCYVEFSDTGVGIPSDKISGIFDRFGQADSSSTRKYEGTGIGLALAKEFIEMHSGSISVESRDIEKYHDSHGTTFKVTFSKGETHLAGKENVEIIHDEELSESVTDHRFAGMREMGDLRIDSRGDDEVISKSSSLIDVLIVEDNPDMRNFLKFLLAEHYRIHLAVNGDEGLKKTRELHPDLIVSDVMMPIMNGYEMTKQIKSDEYLKRIPVLLLTAKAEIANKIEGLEFGADDYLTKPFNSKELLARIRSLLKINMLQKELLELNRGLEDRVKQQLDLLMKGDELKRYLPPQLVDSIIKGEKQVSFLNERKKLTIFFSDIKGFTDTTDSMEAEELSTLLNEYLTEMTKIAYKWGGTIDKFIGDAIMIFFGAPESSTEKDQALRCVNMAVDMQRKMKELRSRWFDSGIEYPLEIRIGINTGTATVGNFGAEERLSYTIIGGQVNIASRLESLCSPGGILISHSTWAHVNQEIPCKIRGKVRVKGIHREILVYDVISEE